MEEDSNSITPEDTFITKILGEMKTQFNNESNEENDETETVKVKLEVPEPQEVIEAEDPAEIETIDIKTENSSDTKTDTSCDSTTEQPRIVMCFRKPNPEDKPSGRRSKRTRIQTEVNVKRSTRRRSSESVLQTAIARKEKSYNETIKPQRLSRQLKPTQKILENIANAAALKEKKTKGKAARFDEDDSKRGKGKVKKIKVEKFLENEDENKYSSVDEIVVKTEDVSQAKDLSDLDSSSAIAQLIASRLCVCSNETQLYVYAENGDNVYCMAIDGVGKRLIGCNNIVNHKKVSMLRPSSRVPYTLLCELHRSRMMRHNCCPTCGIFCTQGKFSQCEKKHQYHRECQITVGEMECCPHCGQNTPKYDIELSMENSKPPIFASSQKVQLGRVQEDCKKLNVKENRRDCSSPPIIPVEELKLSARCQSVEETSQYDIKDLLESIKESNYQEVATILGSRSVCLKTFVEYEKDESGTVLHYSAKNGLLPIIHMLTIAEIDLDILDYDKNTALMLAVLNFQNDTVKYLTKAGANIITKGMDGMTALHLAAKCGNREACEILLSAAAHIKNYVDIADDGGWTPLVWSCEHNHADIVTFLLGENANPLLSDVEENVALHWAAFSGSSKIVELILNFGGQVNVVNSHGDSPLHIAARQDNYNCVLILLARGAKIDVVNKVGESPIDCCPEDCKSFEALSLNVRLQSCVNGNEKEVKKCLSNDISNGIEPFPIPCVNGVDLEHPPNNFLYTTKNCITSANIHIDVRSFKEFCACDNSKSVYRNGKLVCSFNFADPPVIFECNKTCKCSCMCGNRVVQRGSQQRFVLFRTNYKGWAVRTEKFIPRGSFVTEYIGELITETEADNRADDSYLFDLDDTGAATYCIDAKHYGNISRFMNHSCEPNLVPVRVFIDHQDLKFPRIALFANKDINAFEELSFDYGEKFWIIKHKIFTCRCKSANCKYSEDSIQETVDQYYLKIMKE